MGRSRRFSRVVATAASALALAACVRPLFPGSERVFGDERLDPRPERSGVREPAKNAALGRKAVRTKESPGTLVAHDGTRCTVTEKRFRQVREGDMVTCSWRT